MIVVKDLVKEYKTKGKKKTYALKKISFTLPDTGLIFITGKSGSGKSTLLNLIGGLDDITSGEIIAGGNCLSQFSPRSLSNYRSTYVGFIFQNYHLLDDFTVKENIELGADITNIESDYKKCLEIVDLEGYDNRYPHELSGGQRQRVAIARALAKKSRIILADEPTGNLDNKTSKQILDILKEISKTTLIIIVSHNVDDATTYADRIIKLDNGEIFSDETRVDDYCNDFRIENKTLYLPHHTDLNENELDYIVSNVDKYNKIIPIDDGMKPTEANVDTHELIELKKSRLSNKNLFKLFKIIFKRKIASKIVTIFVSVIIISLFYIFQSFTAYNRDEQLINEQINNKEDIIILKKAGYKESLEPFNNIYPVDDKDIDTYYDYGYRGNIYKLYNYCIPISSSSNNEYLYRSITNNIGSFYSLETYGVLNSSEDYLISLYGNNGKLTYYGNLYDKDYGIVITDYIADSIIHFNDDINTYDDVLKEYKDTQIYINAIVETGYKQRYAELIDLHKCLWDDNPNNDNVYNDILNHKKYSSFILEVNRYLGVTYNFLDDYENILYSHKLCDKSSLSGCNLSYGDYSKNLTLTFKYNDTYNLSANDIIMTTSLYNKIFKTEYNEHNIDSFTSQDITLTRNLFSQEYMNTNYRITKLVFENSDSIYLSEEGFGNYLSYKIVPYSIYLDGINHVNDILKGIKDTNYFVLTNDTAGIYYINRVLDLFSDFMKFLAVGLMVVCVIYLVYYGYKSIKTNKYEIGILSALGCSNLDAGKIFILEIICVGIGIIFVGVFGIYFAALFSNKILIASFEGVFNIKLHSLQIISFIFRFVIMDLSITFGVVVLSALLSILFVGRLKPVNILKAKE